jgi:hypothetical protein
LATVEAAKLVYENTYQNGLGDTRKQAVPTIPPSCESEKYKLAPDPVDRISQVLRLWQPGGQECLSSETKHRAFFWLEDTTTGKLFTYNQHTDYFVGYRLYIPSDFPTAYLDSTNNDVIHFQLTRREQGETPVFSFISKDGVTAQLKVNRRYLDGSNKLVKAEEQVVDLVKGGWNSIIFHVKHEYDNTGIYEMWVNGDKVINWQNVRTASNPAQQPSGTTNNVGLYWGTLDRPHTDFQIYIDDFRVAEGSDGFDLVNPGGNRQATAPLSVPTNVQLQILPTN